MGNITSPIRALIERIKHHKNVGYTPPGASEPVKLLAGLTVFHEKPTARADDENDIPNLTIYVPRIADQTEGGPNQAGYSEIEVQMDLCTKFSKGLYSEDFEGFMDYAERLVAAITRNNDGKVDRHLGQTVNKQIAILISDGVSTDLSITASVVVKMQSKFYQ